MVAATHAALPAEPQALGGKIDLLTPIAVFVLYTNAAGIAVRFHGFPVVFALLPMLLLAVPAARDILLRGKPVVVTSSLAFLFCFFVIQTFGALTAMKPGTSIQTLIEWLIEGLVLYLLVTNAVRSAGALRGAIWALMGAGAFIGALATYQQLTGSFDNEFGGFSQVSQASFGAENPEDRQMRLMGPVGEKNRYAQIMAMLIPISLFQYWTERSRSLRFVALGCLLLTTMGFALAFSRGAAVGLGFAFLVLLVMGYVRPRHLLLSVLAVGAVGLVAPQYSSRLESLAEVASIAQPGRGSVANTDGATQGRLTEMAAAVLIFADYPLMGAGPGMYPHHYRYYAESIGGRVAVGNRRSHSLYLNLAADHGLLGIITFTAILVATFRGLNRARRRWKDTRPDLESMATGLEAALIVFFATSIFLHFAYVRYLWLLMGLAGAACYLARNDAPADARA